MLDAAHRSLWNTVQWLQAQGVLVVAAAGNDALRGHLRGQLPPPRYPAYYQPVLAVGASQLDGKPAAYSNRADVLPLGNGVTTFGGRIDLPNSDDAPPVTDGHDRRDGRPQSIVGLYASPTLPGGEPNTTGWVRWAGTSFATAIVSGFAARLWQQDASQTPADLIERVRSVAHNVPSRRRAGTDPDGPLDAPYLEAWQEFEA
jgi:subtilisin family serine protease